MKTTRDLQFRRDIVKLVCLIGAILGTLGVFIVTPALSTPTILSFVITILLSPWVSALERRGHSRAFAIFLIFAGFALLTSLGGFWGFQMGFREWSSFSEKAPEHFHRAIQQMQGFELELKSQYPILKAVHPTDSILKWGEETGSWFVDHGASLMGEFLTWIFIIPILVFVLLNEGRKIRRRFFQLVPNRYFESFFLVTTDITNALSDYIQAKLIEAILLGLMVGIGLAIVGAPYAIVLGIVGGVTNIVPYVGPVLGAVPALFITAFDTAHTASAVSIGMVYVVANLIDTLLIFPVVVAKLVNLHPLILLAVVAVGQHYYGLVGMLISIPIATALKVVLQEIYMAVYESRGMKIDPESLGESIEDLDIN